MRVFVGYGYNDRDRWIDIQVVPILTCMGFTVVDGHDMHGQVIQEEVKSRIQRSDALIAFFTFREGQENADYSSHIWVLNEYVYADAMGKPVIPVKEAGVKVPDGIMGNRQYIPLNQADKLGCVAELVTALGRRNIRRLKIDPEEDQLRRQIRAWRRTQGFAVRYRTQDEGLESEARLGRLEEFDQGFYLNVADVPRKAYVEVEGILNGAAVFSSGWVSADAVQVRVY